MILRVGRYQPRRRIVLDDPDGIDARVPTVWCLDGTADHMLGAVGRFGCFYDVVKDRVFPERIA